MRLVDGDALWRSRRVKNLPVDLRLHYANWIPMAEANGVFEAEADVIQNKIYSFLRPDIIEDDVAEILQEFVRVGLVVTWEERGKTWGFFVGMDKRGRLPGPAHIKRFSFGIPSYPGAVIESSGEVPVEFPSDSRPTPVEFPCGVGVGVGLDGCRIGVGEKAADTPMLEKPQNLNETLPASCRTILGLEPEPDALWKPKLKALLRAFPDSGRVARAFQQWAEAEKGTARRFPIGDFLQAATGILTGIIQVERNPELDPLNARMKEIGGRAFGGKDLSGLQELLLVNSVEDIATAYKSYVENMDDFHLQNAPREFAAGAGRAELIAVRNRREKEKQRQANLEASLAEDRRKRALLDAAAAAERDKSTGVCENDF